MRTYVGTTDPVTGRTNVVITEPHDHAPSALLDAVRRIDNAVVNRHGLHASPYGHDPLRKHSARLHDLLDRSEAPTTRPLPHIPVDSPHGFSWGHPGRGAANLAVAILHREIGDTVPPTVYLPFRDQVIARLPTESFKLPATQVWEWIRANRTLVDSAVVGAEPHPPPSTPRAASTNTQGLSL